MIRRNLRPQCFWDPCMRVPKPCIKSSPRVWVAVEPLREAVLLRICFTGKSNAPTRTEGEGSGVIADQERVQLS